MVHSKEIMSWFFLALIGPLLYALTNHIDKILLEKYFKNGGVGTLILFSSLLSVFVLPFLWLMDTTVLQVSPLHIGILIVTGILAVLVLWCYLLALKDDEASVVIIFYQLVPVFGYVLGYFILGEVLTNLQLIAMSIIILGTTVISFEIDMENKFKFRTRTVIPMLLASFFWALESVLLKMVAIEEDVWRSLFWEHVALVITGIIIFISVRSYRQHFLSAIKNNSKAIISLNMLNESLYISGNIAFAFAYMLAPIALILLANSFQAIFVLIIGMFLTMFFPKLAMEKIHRRHLWQKGVAIFITAVGTYFLLIP